MKKSQSSIEYVIIIGFTLFIITPMIIFATSQIGSQKQQIRGEQLYTIGKTIIDAAQHVYFQGEPAKLTVDVSIPSQVKIITISSREISFFYNTDLGTDSVSVPSPVNITGSIPTKPGRYRIRITSQGDYVEISH